MKKIFSIIIIAIFCAVSAEAYIPYLPELEQKAKQGDAQAQYDLGNCYLINRYDELKNCNKAEYWFAKAAEQGHVGAQYRMEQLYSWGIGSGKIERKIVKRCSKAAKNGDASAQWYLGFLYDNDLGVTDDGGKAIYWYAKAAEQGYAIAQYCLGRAYQNSYVYRDGESSDYGKAVYWYTKAAEQGFAGAMVSLGYLYQEGKVVPQDHEKASCWFAKAAEQGDESAQNALGECYLFGRGVEQDFDKAVYWFNKAKDQGLIISEYFEADYLAPYVAKANAGMGYTPGQSVESTNVEGKLVVKIDEGQKSIGEATLPDVDCDIPTCDVTNDKIFAVIIGNENYRRVAKVEFALNDASVFAEYCHKTLGLPEQNIKVYKDATLGDIKDAIRKIQRIAAAYKGDLNVIFYYAGHGIPDETSKSAQLLPTDTDGSFADLCVPVDELYSELASMNAKSVTVFLDACFSGAARGDGMLAAARGVAIKAKHNAPQGKMVVFSAATDDQTAYPIKEKGHGMFTYYLLKKLKETCGDVTLGELADYVFTNVTRQSAVVNDKEQTPTTTAAPGYTAWKSQKLR